MQRILQLSKLTRFTRRKHLNMALVSIPNPSPQPNLRRLPLHKPAKPNPLHATFDEVMTHHGESSLAEPIHPRKAHRMKTKRQSPMTLPLNSQLITYARLM